MGTVKGKFFVKDELEDTVYSYFRSGDLTEKYAVKKGLKNGDYFRYYENGQLYSKYTLKDDVATLTGWCQVADAVCSSPSDWHDMI